MLRSSLSSELTDEGVVLWRKVLFLLCAAHDPVCLLPKNVVREYRVSLCLNRFVCDNNVAVLRSPGLDLLSLRGTKLLPLRSEDHT